MEINPSVIKAQLRKNPEELIVSGDGHEIYTLVRGRLIRVTGADFTKMTGRAIVEFVREAVANHQWKEDE